MNQFLLRDSEIRGEMKKLMVEDCVECEMSLCVKRDWQI